MADNVTIPTTGAGTATPVIATDDVGGVHYQKVKIALGAESAIDMMLDSGQQTMTNSLPVVLASNHSDISVTLDGEGVTISGTVQVQSDSANLATQATVAAIQTAVEIIDNAIAGNEMQVDLVGGGPIGATTDAEAAADGSVIAILKRLRTLLAGTLTATISGTVAVTQSGTWDEVGINDSGNSITVDAPVGTPVFVRLSDGAAAITTLPVSLASVPSHAVTNAGTFTVQESGAALTALQLIDDTVFAEDVAAQAGDKGIQVLAVRRDADTSLVGTDNDYAPLQVNANGALKVEIFDGGDSHTIDGTVVVSNIQDGAGDSVMDADNNAVRVNIVAGAAAGGTSITDDTAFTPASSALTPIGGMFDDVSPDTIDEGDAGVARMTSYRALHVNLRDNDGNELAVGGGTQYTEDAAAAANPVGTSLMLVREDARAGSLTTADGDNVAARGNNRGELYVKDTDAATLLTTIDADTGNIATSVAVMDDWDESDRAKVNIIAGQAGVTAGAGSVAANTPRVTLASDDPAVANLGEAISYLDMIQGGQLPAYTEDAAAAANPAGPPLILVRDDSLAGSLVSANGDNVAARGNNKGEQYVKDTDAGALLTTIDDDTSQIRTSSVMLATTVQIEDTAHSTGHHGISVFAVRRDEDTSLVNADGDYAPLQVNAGGALKVGGSIVVTNIQDGTGDSIMDAAANALRVNIVAASSSVNVAGGVAHDAADSGPPVKTGHKAKNFDGTAPGTAVAEDDRVDSIADLYGRQYVETTHPNYWTLSADYASAQTNTSLKTAPGAGLKLYITDVIVSNGATAGNITLLNGSGGAVLLELYPGVNGGLSMPFRTPLVLSADTALCLTSTTVTTHSVTICGYTAP